MARYHVNPETGDPGICSAKINCPFGGPEDHYPTALDAAKARELADTNKLIAALQSKARGLKKDISTSTTPKDSDFNLTEKQKTFLEENNEVLINDSMYRHYKSGKWAVVPHQNGDYMGTTLAVGFEKTPSGEALVSAELNFSDRFSTRDLIRHKVYVPKAPPEVFEDKAKAAEAVAAVHRHAEKIFPEYFPGEFRDRTLAHAERFSKSEAELTIAGNKFSKAKLGGSEVWEIQDNNIPSVSSAYVRIKNGTTSLISREAGGKIRTLYSTRLENSDSSFIDSFEAGVFLTKAEDAFRVYVNEKTNDS